MHFAQMTDGGRMLDVGCGTGALVRTVAAMTRQSAKGEKSESIGLFLARRRPVSDSDSYRCRRGRAVYDVTMESSFRHPPHEQFLKGQTVIGETLKHRR